MSRPASLIAVSSKRVPGGVVHELPADLRDALIANSTALAAWKDITPLARNEFICWVEDAKQQRTRKRRIRRTQEELEEGQRRPSGWPGWKHRERTGRGSAPAGGARPAAEVSAKVRAWNKAGRILAWPTVHARPFEHNYLREKARAT